MAGESFGIRTLSVPACQRPPNRKQELAPTELRRDLFCRSNLPVAISSSLFASSDRKQELARTDKKGRRMKMKETDLCFSLRNSDTGADRD